MVNDELMLNCQCADCQLRDMFFSHLEKEEMLSLCNLRKENSFEADEMIIKQGDEVKDFIYLKEGLVKLHLQQKGGEDQIITIAKPLDFISILSVFSSNTYQYSVTALVPTVVCKVKMSVVKRFVDKNSAFTYDLMSRLSKATDGILIETMELKRLQMKGKLAFILLKFANHIYRTTSFDLPVTRKEIAEYAGVSTENIIRALSEFRKDRIIRISGREIEIINMDRLEQIAKFG